MKLKSLLAIAIVATFAFSSCKKDYSCECTVLGTTTTNEFGKQKKSDAEDACNQLDAAAKTVSGSCKLKSK